MKEITTLSNKTIWYSNDRNEISSHVLRNWLFLPIVDDLKLEELDRIAKAALANQAIYVCCLGKQCEKLHDIIDENYSLIELGIIEGKTPEFFMQTTWHHDFEEGIAFSTFTANHPNITIENIFCLDLSVSEKRFTDLISNFIKQ